MKFLKRGDVISFGLSSETVDKHKVSFQFLDQYAISSWENVLHYLGKSN
jgi:hypothetical protein